MSTSFDSKIEKAITRTELQKGASKRSKDGKEKQKAISIGSTPEDDNKRIKLGCKIRMLVGYGEVGEITDATIITTKEEVDDQFQYPERNKVIKEYKYITDNYSWDDEFESEKEITKSSDSPKIYDLRSPQKKSSKMEMYSDYTSEKLFKKYEDTQNRRTRDSIPIKPTTSAKLVSIPVSKQKAMSLVDMILMEESNRDKPSTKGTITTRKVVVPEDT